MMFHIGSVMMILIGTETDDVHSKVLRAMRSKSPRDQDSKKCENGNKVMEEDNINEEKMVVKKSVGIEGSFFDCYICMDLSKKIR
ncbi:hypothetical protein YC2023_017367 [Brassica napus]